MQQMKNENVNRIRNSQQQYKQNVTFVVCILFHFQTNFLLLLQVCTCMCVCLHWIQVLCVSASVLISMASMFGHLQCSSVSGTTNILAIEITHTFQCNLFFLSLKVHLENVNVCFRCFCSVECVSIIIVQMKPTMSCPFSLSYNYSAL